MPHVTLLHADDPVRVGRYRLSGRITGMPGSGSAYLGNGVDGSNVTVALLRGEWTEEPAERDRFMAEASAARRVLPLCTARVLASGFDGGQAFLVSEYVPGPSLDEVVADEGPWKGHDLEALAIGTATGLAAVHDAGLVHGEFGPEYVVLGPEGPRVVEYGISPPYGSATPSADMRAWAYMVLYTAAGGPADPADIDLLTEPLASLVAQCLAANPADRPSARSVVARLLGVSNPISGVLTEGARRGGAAAWRERPAAQRTAAPARGRPGRGPTIWVAGIAAVVVVAGAIAVLATQILRGHDSNAATSPSALKKPTLTSATPRPRRLVPVPADLVGSWSGRVTQNGPADVFTVQVSLASGAATGSIHYSGTSVSCTGTLTPVSASPGSLKLDQAITHGGCAGGVVFLTAGPDGALGFRFQGKSGPAAVGSLTKS